MWSYHVIDCDPRHAAMKQYSSDSHLSMLEIYSSFNRHLIYMKCSLWNNTYINTPQSYSRALWHAPQTEPETLDNMVNLSAVFPWKYYQWN